MDVVTHNRNAWNNGDGCRYCTPYSKETIDAARNGDWELDLMPKEWFGELKGAKVLCLASGGGQQAPLLAAAGASVTSFDNSDDQLALDKLLADRHSLDLQVVQGDMADLRSFENEAFDLVLHTVSNLFVPDVKPVWRECFRVLRWRGRLVSAFMNPSFFLFDHPEAEAAGTLEVKYSLPFSELSDLPKKKLDKLIQDGDTIEFGHTLSEQIGGQIAAGFIISGLQEDSHSGEGTKVFDQYCTRYISTLARKVRIEQGEVVNSE